MRRRTFQLTGILLLLLVHGSDLIAQEEDLPTLFCPPLGENIRLLGVMKVPASSEGGMVPEELLEGLAVAEEEAGVWYSAAPEIEEEEAPVSINGLSWSGFANGVGRSVEKLFAGGAVALFQVTSDPSIILEAICHPLETGDALVQGTAAGTVGLLKEGWQQQDAELLAEGGVNTLLAVLMIGSFGEGGVRNLPQRARGLVPEAATRFQLPVRSGGAIALLSEPALAEGVIAATQVTEVTAKAAQAIGGMTVLHMSGSGPFRYLEGEGGEMTPLGQKEYIAESTKRSGEKAVSEITYREKGFFDEMIVEDGQLVEAPQLEKTLRVGDEVNFKQLTYEEFYLSRYGPKVPSVVSGQGTIVKIFRRKGLFSRLRAPFGARQRVVIQVTSDVESGFAEIAKQQGIEVIAARKIQGVSGVGVWEPVLWVERGEVLGVKGWAPSSFANRYYMSVDPVSQAVRIDLL